jgi:hypothetical protein
MFARVSATISTERRVGIGAVVCCWAAAKEYRHGKGLCDRAPMWQLFAALIIAFMLRRRPMLEPCLPRPAKEPPAGPGWIHEIKYDGFRILARRDAQGVRLVLHALGRSSSASILAKAVSSFVRSSIRMPSRGRMAGSYVSAAASSAKFATIRSG